MFIIFIITDGKRDPKRLSGFLRFELQVFRGDKNGGRKMKKSELSESHEFGPYKILFASSAYLARLPGADLTPLPWQSRGSCSSRFLQGPKWVDG